MPHLCYEGWQAGDNLSSDRIRSCPRRGKVSVRNVKSAAGLAVILLRRWVSFAFNIPRAKTDGPEVAHLTRTRLQRVSTYAGCCVLDRFIL